MIDDDSEVWVVGMYINPYPQGGRANPEPTRRRKLLLHAREIRKLKRETTQKGRTLVPLALYFKRGKAKMEIGVCQGKQRHDKRDAIRERDLERQAGRELAGRDRE